jgi:hypothetical protein
MRLPTVGFVVTGALNAARRFLSSSVPRWSRPGRHPDGEAGRAKRPRSRGYSPLQRSAFPAVRAYGARRAGRAPRSSGGRYLRRAWWCSRALGCSGPGGASPVQLFRYAQLSVAFHLMAAFLPTPARRAARVLAVQQGVIPAVRYRRALLRRAVRGAGHRAAGARQALRRHRAGGGVPAAVDSDRLRIQHMGVRRRRTCRLRGARSPEDYRRVCGSLRNTCWFRSLRSTC